MVFRREVNIGSPIYDLAHRLFAIAEGKVLASGTCVNVCGNLMLTAKHVITDFNRRFGVEQYNLWVIQITNDEDLYAVWQCVGGSIHTTSDLALLRVVPYNDKAAELRQLGLLKQPRLHLQAPRIGSKVTAFGFASSAGGSTISINSEGGPHYDITDEPYTTQGLVEEIHPEGRDRSMLNFPCYRVNFRSSGGMSGGPVFNEAGQLCGIIASGMDIVDEQGAQHYKAYVTTLHPIMNMPVDADRGNKYPRGVTYPFHELVAGGFVQLAGQDSTPPR